MTTDSYAEIQRELVTLVRGLHSAHTLLRVDGAPALERAPYLLLVKIKEHGGLRPSALAELVYVELSTVSRQLASLEAAGWVRRERDPEDGRAWRVRLTAAGTRVLAANSDARRAALRSAVEDWTEDERRTFAALLARLNTGFAGRRGRRTAVAPVPAVTS